MLNMNESLFERLIETSWRRRLTPQEEAELQAWLAGHPGDGERWAAEAGLNDALEGLPTPVPSSNFTTRVLELIELDQRAARRQREREKSWLGRWQALWSRQGVRLAWTMALVLLVGVGYHEYRNQAHLQIVQGVNSVSTVAAAMPVEAMEDFDAVHALSQVRPESNQTDEALYALLAGN